MSDCDLITVDTGWLSNEIKNVPHLSERALLDVVNGIEVVEGQLAFKSRQGCISRLWGSLDGSNQRRESIIQQTQQATMRGLMNWTRELAAHETMTKRALVCVAKKLQTTRSDLAEVAKHSAENRKLIDENRSLIEDLSARVTEELVEAEARLKKLEARSTIDEGVTAWQSRDIYQGYSRIVSAAFLIDDLVGGKIGQLILADSSLEHHLINSVVVALRQFELGPNEDATTTDLLLDYENETIEQRALAAWLLGNQSDAKLHQTIADTREVKCARGCVYAAEQRGDVLPRYSGRTLTRKLFREARSALVLRSKR